jgi:RNA polymerase sigma factor (TIGR02999 family)
MSDRVNVAPELTALLHAARGGDERALGALFTSVYDELRRLAHRVRHESASETLNTTALVHEAYLKLLPSGRLDLEGRAHFFGVAARAMRQVLVDAARRRGAAKRGGGALLVTFQDQPAGEALQVDQLVALDDALQRLQALNERQVRVVEHRFFAGLNTRETAEVMGLSVPTVERDWRFARAWLARELGGEGP